MVGGDKNSTLPGTIPLLPKVKAMPGQTWSIIMARDHLSATEHLGYDVITLFVKYFSAS